MAIGDNALAQALQELAQVREQATAMHVAQEAAEARAQRAEKALEDNRQELAFALDSAERLNRQVVNLDEELRRAMRSNQDLRDLVKSYEAAMRPPL